MENVNLSEYDFFDYVQYKPFISLKFQHGQVLPLENILRFFTGNQYAPICVMRFTLSEVNIKKMHINAQLDMFIIDNINDKNAAYLYAHKKN